MSTFIFDIDGTLADATHRLPYINEPANWSGPFKRNWDMFFNPHKVIEDTVIPEMWQVLTGLVHDHHDILFITGRPEKLRSTTYEWLTNMNCKYRCLPGYYWQNHNNKPVLYMRSDGDRRPSAEVKRDRLRAARLDGFNPKMAFDDRAADIAMYRQQGLIGCQVNEGAF